MLFEDLFLDHLHDRGVRPWHRLWVDRENQLASFPLWDLDGRLVGYQRYDWRATKVRDNVGKYFTRTSKVYPNHAVYGLDNCYGYGPLFVVEGIFDALRVSSAFVDCVAILTATPSKGVREYVRLIANGRTIISLTDNDDAVTKLPSLGNFSFKTPAPFDDPNDMSETAMMHWITEIKNSLPLAIQLTS